MIRKFIFLTTLFLLVFGGGKAWADEASFTFNSSNSATTVGPISITGGTPGTNGYNASGTISVNATTGYNISNITFTFSSGTDANRYGGTVTASSGTYTHEENSTSGTWNGGVNSVTFTPTGKFRITAMTVTYAASSVTEYSYIIPIEDLRYEHLTYSPNRIGILGDLTITATGWMSNTNSSSYTLMLDGNLSSTFTVTSTSANITKVVLVGADGSGTFSDVATVGTETYKTTNQDQMVWQGNSASSTATVSFTTNSARPHISEIYVFTNSALSGTKQNVALSFDNASSTADANITDYQISGRVIASVNSTSNSYFRPDDFTISNSGSNATINQFHLSTGKVGVNTGSTSGTATITPTFSGNQFYNAIGSGSTASDYTLNINGGATEKTKTITINDMRISKTANTNGLDCSDQGLDRTLGGFSFTHTGGQGVKFNNSDFIILRNQGSGSQGSITIAPQVNSGKTVTISKVVINTVAGYTTGSVTATVGTGTSGTINLNGLSTYTFDNVNASSFVLTSVSGDVYIQSYTIYYESEEGALNDDLITPTITFSKPSDTVSGGDTYTSPTITVSPKNFDITLSSSNTDVATVKTSNWTIEPLVSLAGETGSTTITVSATASTYFNAANDATYTVTYTDASAEKWDFRTLNVTNTINATDWKKSGDYYENQFTSTGRFDTETATTYATTSSETSQIYGLLFGRDNSGGLTAGQIRLFSNHMTFTNSAIAIAVPVAAGDKVLVTFDGGNGSTQAGFTFTNAQVEGDASATSITSDDTQTTATLVAQAAGYVTLKVSKSKVKLYRIQVSTETRRTLSMRDTSNSYEKYVGTGTSASEDNHFSHRVMLQYSDYPNQTNLTYADDASKLHITSSDPSVLDVSSVYIPENSFGKSSSFYFANIIPKAAGTATLTITFDGNNNYKPFSYVSQTYTVYGPGAFQVQAEDQQIQQGQFSLISPTITDADGNLIGIKLREDGSGKYTTYVLGEDEDIPDYTDYFDFTYTPGEGSGENYEKITMDDAIANKVLTEEDEVAAAVGATRVITISATPKTEYSSAFTTGTSAVTTTATMTIIEKIKNPQIHLYWDAACTMAISETYTESSEEKWRIKAENATQAEDKQWVFNGTKFTSGFPNGRMIYAKVINPGDSIWFSYEQNAEASTIPANPTLNKAKRIFEYRRGIPIYIDDDLSGSDYVTLNIVATTWNASTRKRNLNGSVARIKFPKIIAHTRPAQPTYDPVSPDADASLNKDGRKIMNTSENVVAYGEGASKGVTGVNNLVYGKFSTSTVYTTEQLINEKTVTYRRDNVPVVSTEVAKRRFTSVQIKTESEGNDYISEQTYTEYWYLYDTDMRITPDRYDINVNSYTTESPAYTVTWYNKKTGKNQEVDSYAGKITYEIVGRNGAANASLDTSTGIVTSGSGQGWVRVKITYTGGEQHGGVSGEPQYTSTTDESWAYYYVYIFDSSKERPTITPPTRNFTGKMTFTIKAPETWTTYYTYTTDGSDPAEPTTSSSSIAATASKSFEIGDVTTADGKIALGVGDVLKVKAKAFHPSDATLYSAVVSEAYTRKAPLPDPVFDPDGTVGDGYIYNTSDLIVQIACAYAGSIIYYTISDLSAEHPDPVIGAENTYRYSGLSKVTVVGEKVIKAIAYDPVQEIYSNVVTSTYRYSSEMLKPYFQISNDEGATWYGFSDETTWAQNGTAWNNGQSHEVTPLTQIRIIDPNPVTGTIFYTVDGSTPADNSTTMIYSEGYPFTVAKTTTGKAITILEDASSPLSTANFTISTATYGNVWEAVAQTTPEGKMLATDGFVISTNSDLATLYAGDSNNSGTHVNLNSVTSSDITGGTASKTYAQADITATFGGLDLKDWGPLNIADAATGSPMDAVGTYSIKGVDNAKMEATNSDLPTPSDNYNHVNSYAPTTIHEKTFKLPAMGSYVRFEPEKDGDLTIWVLQQGAVHYEEDEYFIDRYIRMKPVYMVDEQGKSYQVKTINGVPQLWSSARLSENWTRLQAIAAENGGAGGWASYDRDGEGGKKVGDYIYLNYNTGEVTTTKPSDFEGNNGTKKSDGKKYKQMENKGPNRAESQTLYNLYKADLDKNHVSVGDPIKPFAIHTGTAISQNNGNYSDDSNDGTGYVLVSGGYAKYTFEVKAGKTYFFFATGSKIGVRGFQFVPTETAVRPTITFHANATDDASTVNVNGVERDLATVLSTYANTTVDVIVERNFSNHWAAIALPFSVSATQMEKVFGAGTEISHFRDIINSGRTIAFRHHKNQMLVAGTPAIIYPTKTNMSSVKFEGVQLEADAVETMTGDCDDFSMIGTFVCQPANADYSLKRYDYYFGANDGVIYRFNNSEILSQAIQGTRAWLRPKDPEASSARMLSVGFEEVDDDEYTTGIVEITDDGLGERSKAKGAIGIYNLKGQKVGEGSLEGLAKGVYIINGKKMVVE